MLEKLQTWAHNVEAVMPALGYIMLAVIGGIVAHIREWEKLNPNYSFRDHCWAIIRRTVMAVLAGLMWFLIMLEQGWTAKPLAYVGASLVGLFSPEFFDWLWGLYKARLGRAAEKEQPK